MIVVDASVLANALTDDGPLGHVARTELGRDVHWAGPEHLLVETFSAVRGRLLAGKLAVGRARDAVDALAKASIELLPTALLLPRMWQLRDNLSGYDAAYVAAAEAQDCLLLTSDARVARTPRVRCRVRVAVPV